MIHESWPWKRELLRDADILERWSKKPTTERRGFIIEKKVFLAAYSMRKLLQAGKLSTSTIERSIGCRCYPPVVSQVRMARHYLDGYYDFSCPSAAQMPARRLLDLIIHSFIFAEAMDDVGVVTSFLITSDTTKERGLWEIPLAAFLKIMRKVGQDMPSHGVRAFDPKTGEWFTWAGNGEPPQHVLRRIEEIRKGFRSA